MNKDEIRILEEIGNWLWPDEDTPTKRFEHVTITRKEVALLKAGKKPWEKQK